MNTLCKELGEASIEPKQGSTQKFKYPVCPECHYNTLVGFAHDDVQELYCSNDTTNCRYRVAFRDLHSLRDEKLYQVSGQAIDKLLLDALKGVLQRHVGERGDNEGALNALERIIDERNILLDSAIKTQLFKRK
jgi:hypothetical protein